MAGRKPLPEGATHTAVTVKIPVELKEQLVEMAAKDDRTFHHYLVRILKEHVEANFQYVDLEDD